MRRTNSQWMAPSVVGTVLGLLALSQLSASGRPFGMVDTNFTRLRFTAAAYPGYVNSDGRGGLIWSFVNWVPFDGADGQKLGGIVRATEAGSLDASFAVGPALRGCFGVVAQPDGNVFVGATLVGDVSPNGVPNYRVFRVLTNGAIDFSYSSPVFDGGARFMALQPDGQLIVAGGGAVTPQGNGGIATTVRLRSDGSLDTDFHAPVFTLGGLPGVFGPPVLDGEGRIYLGGGFVQVNGASRPGLARLLPNGDLDTSFTPSGYSYSQGIRGIVLQGDKVVIGGRLQRTGDAAFYVLLRLNSDGSLDNTFNLVTADQAGFFRTRRLRETPDGHLLAVSQCVARFNADGSLDNSFTRLPFYDSNQYVNSECYWFELLSNGKIVVPATVPLQVGTNLVSGAFRLNADGTFDPSFNPPAFETQVFPNAAFQSDGRLLVWGTFDKVGGVQRRGLARLNHDGTLDSTYAFSACSDVAAVSPAVALADGSLYAVVSHGLSLYSGITSNNLVHITASGLMDTNFQPSIELPSSLIVPNLFLQNDKLLLSWNDEQSVVDGVFPFYRLNANGSMDPSFVGLPNAMGEVSRDAETNITTVIVGSAQILANLPGGKLLAAGCGHADGNCGIARLNTNGNFEVDFGLHVPGGPSTTSYSWVWDPVLSQDVYVQVQYAGANPFSAGAVLPDGSMLVAGSFRQLGGYGIAGLAKLLPSGAVDPTFPQGPGAAISTDPSRAARVDSVRLDSTGKIWITGNFDEFNGGSAKGVIRLNTNGTVDTSFVPQCAYYGLNESYGGPQTDVALASDGSAYLLGTYCSCGQLWPEALTRLVEYGPPTLASLGHVPGWGYWMSLNVVDGQPYRLQASSDLRNWADVLILKGEADPLTVCDPAAEYLPQRFYRLVEP